MSDRETSRASVTVRSIPDAATFSQDIQALEDGIRLDRAIRREQDREERAIEEHEARLLAALREREGTR